MGGGAAMRAAAKVAGLGVSNGGLRGGGNHVVSAARRSVASGVSSSDDVKLAIANKTTNSSVEKGYDDWEFADELLNDPMPRLVFGGAPTIQEAKQATSDLGDALDKTYLSSNDQNSSLLFDLEHVETKPCLVTDTCASKHAIQAFRLLHENTEAQNVVASIASDPNVWTAVLKNEALVDFLQTHKTSVIFPQVNDERSPEASESKSASGKGFRDYVEDIKQKISVTVVDMMTSFSDTFLSLFAGGSAKGQEYTMNPDGTAGISVEKTTIAATLMGLAIMVITVVVLKRA
ncbi:uncharacterized protein LOC112506612 [Cynara cardunculus var. scolymus]|uniref:Uncharacterized protein n=1 Tax=Cynara cardunculus var. scolymus TaxID=59895 RepID=A0A103YJM5_CYNCS|nr:uncharacterized protein LOC112506612 [Cynara cardunculus var. scolymus]KVI10370.1 hypothetical protein Ccrd_011253 [Cynara cardunculus var. scolymus]